MNLQFFERLLQFRESTGLTQDEMAKQIEMSKRSYCAYEAGETAPSAKLLTALAVMGADVAYLLTGIRSAPMESTLNKREQALLDNYRHSGDEGQRAIEQTASALSQSALSQSAEKTPRKKRA